MNAPDLLDAVHIAWVSLLRQELISASNIEHAPLQLLATVLEASKSGRNDPHSLADVAVRHWLALYVDSRGMSCTIH